jgi:F-type H+-transporting ATPase subunit b
MEKLGINIGYLIMQVLLFTILFNVLKGYLYTPILNMMDERKQRIAKGLEDARQAAIARDNAEAESKKIMDAARAEAAKIRAEAVTAAESSTKGIEAQAREEARQIVARAEADANERRTSALGDLRGQISALAIAAAGKIVGESLDEKRQHELVENFFAKVPASVSGLKGKLAEVTSALPLTDAEKDAARKSISADKVTFKVNPSILGGLIIKVDDQVIDNSVAGQMESMRSSLN